MWGRRQLLAGDPEAAFPIGPVRRASTGGRLDKILMQCRAPSMGELWIVDHSASKG